MAALMLSMTACATKEETTKKNRISGKKTSTEETSDTEEETSRTAGTEATTESEETDPPQTSDDTQNTVDTSDPGTTVSTDTSGTDDPAGTLKLYKDRDLEYEIPLAGYTSGPDPIFIINGYYEASGGTTDAMQEVRNKYLDVITDESPLNITKDLYLPDEIDGIPITWSSSDESLIDATGKVTRPFERSQYVILTATLTGPDGTMTLREVFRVARNMYDGIDPMQLLSLDDGYIWPDNVGYYYEELEGSEGAWYIFEYLEDIVFFDPYPDDMSLYDRSTGPWIGYLLGGQFSDPRVDTAWEAYLSIASLRNILGFADQFDQLEYEGTTNSMGDVVYDFVQYYQGVRVQSGYVRVLSSFWRPYTTINISLLQIPKDFSTTSEVTAEQVMADHNLANAELMILENEGDVKLVYTGYRTRGSEAVIVDAMTGEEIASYSTIVT